MRLSRIGQLVTARSARPRPSGGGLDPPVH